MRTECRHSSGLAAKVRLEHVVRKTYHRSRKCTKVASELKKETPSKGTARQSPDFVQRDNSRLPLWGSGSVKKRLSRLSGRLRGDGPDDQNPLFPHKTRAEKRYDTLLFHSNILELSSQDR